MTSRNEEKTDSWLVLFTWSWSHKPTALASAEDETRRRRGTHAVDRSHESIYETSSDVMYL